MKHSTIRNMSFLLALAMPLLAQDAAEEPAAEPAKTEAPAPEPPAEPEPPETPATEPEKQAPEEAKPEQQPAEPAKKAEPSPLDKMKEALGQMTLENSFIDEQVKRETAKSRAEIVHLRVEKDLLTERLALKGAQRATEQDEEIAKILEERNRVTNESELAKAQAALSDSKLKTFQAESAMELVRLQNEINQMEMREKRKNYANSEPVYLENPLREDGTLVISDRRIAMNGAVTSQMADYIATRIHYYNNQNTKYPIFIVIDDSPGGSVMAGYRILKSMHSSDAPVHVVVKSFAASMAACIATLAAESYAYPNTIFLHHQISNTLMGRLNLTQQREMVQESDRWWDRLGTPVAQKMGITTEEFIKRMYEHVSSGDWSEFGDEAQRLKWVNHIVTAIEETSIRVNPDMPKAAPAPGQPQKGSVEGYNADMVESIDEDGRPYMYLPRTNPKDVWFMYNPDGYFRVR